MPIHDWFTFLMKREPDKSMKTKSNKWIIDESKCMSAKEVALLRATASKAIETEIRCGSFPKVRRWFMIELDLHAGLRVAEMASLRHRDLFLDDERSSIVVIGKGNKKRAIWVNSSFKVICQQFIEVKSQRGFGCGLRCVSIEVRQLFLLIKRLLFPHLVC